MSTDNGPMIDTLCWRCGGRLRHHPDERPCGEREASPTTLEHDCWIHASTDDKGAADCDLCHWNCPECGTAMDSTDRIQTKHRQDTGRRIYVGVWKCPECDTFIDFARLRDASPTTTPAPQQQGASAGDYEAALFEMERAYDMAIFTPLSDEDVTKLVKAMGHNSDVRAPSDRLHASWARHLTAVIRRRAEHFASERSEDTNDPPPPPDAPRAALPERPLDIEAIQKRYDATLSGLSSNPGVYYESSQDVPALLEALAEARAERDALREDAAILNQLEEIGVECIHFRDGGELKPRSVTLRAAMRNAGFAGLNAVLTRSGRADAVKNLTGETDV